MAWSAPLAGAWQDTTSHLRQGRGMQAMRKGGQRWLHIGFTSLPPAAAVLERFEVFGTLAAEGCVHPALRLGTSRLGVHQRPTLHDAAVGRLQPVRAIAFWQRSHRGGVDLGPGHWRGGSGGWDAGDPLAACVGELL